MLVSRFAPLVVVVLVAAVAAGVFGQSWNVTDSNFATAAMAVAAVGESTVLVAASINGQGSAVLVSTDAGSTFDEVPAPNVGMYLGGAAVGSSAVVSGVFGVQSSPSGPYNFTSVSVSGGITSQSVEAFAGDSSAAGWYGVTGVNLVGGNGVLVTSDGGASFTFYNVSELVTQARYGSFPSSTTWYLSAGSWPNNNARAGDEDVGGGEYYELSQRLAVHSSGSFRLRTGTGGARGTEPGSASGDDGWQAQIVKTTDGGQTWTSVFYATGGFYFNQISCSDEVHCIAVGEADGTDGSSPGFRALMTTDGGATWKQTLLESGSTMSALAVRCVSDTEWWVAGADLGTVPIAGRFFHSFDGGATWEVQNVPDAYAVSLAMVPGLSRGYATAVNTEQVASFLIYQ